MYAEYVLRADIIFLEEKLEHNQSLYARSLEFPADSV
jgi:hypothetical protein